MDYPEHTVLSVVTGSRAYGLQTAGSDTDRRGVFAVPAARFWLLDKPPTHLEGPRPEQFSWELERFCVLALQANPTVLECLWSPIVELVTPIGEELLAIRRGFVSARARQTFVEYADSQFRRLDPAAPNWKQAMHMIRLLLSGRRLLRYGEPMVEVGEHRDRLLAVRRGEVPFAEVTRWREELAAELERLPDALPERPDRAAVEQLLVSARKASL